MNEFKALFRTLTQLFKNNSVFRLVSIFSVTLFVIMTLGTINCAYAAEPAFFQTPTDKIPNYAQNPTCKSTQSGNWSSASTWDAGCQSTPGAGDVVKIEPGHTVIYDQSTTAALDALGVEGKLSFKPDADTRMHVGTIMVYRAGTLEIGTATNPIANDKTSEIVFNDTALDTIFDPSQYGGGLVILGKIETHGRDIGLTFSRLTNDVLTGQTIISVNDDVVNWAQNDEIIFPDSRQRIINHKYSSQPVEVTQLNVERVSISNVSTNTITLVNPLTADHKGITSEDGTKSYTPHIANLTRNVIFRSANAAGTRAHGMATERAAVDIRYTSFVDMGRTKSDPLHVTEYDAEGSVTQVGTNQIGRYPFHLHHHMGPINPSNTGYQAVISGNVFDGCEKWCLSVHNAHWNLIENNAFVDATGSGFMTEEGNERENEIVNNIAIKIGEPINNWYKPRYGGVAGLEPFRSLGFGDFGYEGTGFWYNGNDNIMVGNVTATASYAAHMLNARSGGGFGILTPREPNRRGADIDNDNDWTQYTQTQWAPSVRLMDSNEGYGVAEGLWVSFSGDVGTVTNTVIWHSSQLGLYSTRNLRATYDGLVLLNDPSVTYTNNYRYESIGLSLGNPRYESGHNVIKNAHVEGYLLSTDLPAAIKQNEPQLGITTPPETVVEDSKLRGYVNVRDHSTIHGYPKLSKFNNVIFEQVPGAPINPSLGHPYISANATDFVPVLEGSISISTSTSLSQIQVTDYNGVSGQDFNVFFAEQAPGYVMAERLTPQGNAMPLENCPTVGLTNQQCWDTHGVAMMGEVATCTDTTVLINGFACGTVPNGQNPITVNACADAIINEGDPFNCTVNVSGGTGTGRTYTINPGNETGSIPDGATSFNFVRSYPDGPYTENVTIDITDDGSNAGSDGVSITVNDIIPMGSISGTGNAMLNQPYTITVSITDPGDDPITEYKIRWEAGGAQETIPAGNPLEHTYTCANAYQIEVTVVNDDGEHLIGTHDVTVTCACGQ